MNLINQNYIRFLNFKCLENNKDYSILSTFDTITRVKSNQDNRIKEFTILELKKRFKNVKKLPAGTIH